MAIIVERAGLFAWMHESWIVRKEFVRTVTYAFGLFASTELPVLDQILQMLNDPDQVVVEGEIQCIVV